MRVQRLLILAPLSLACTHAPEGPLAGASDAWQKNSETHPAPPAQAPAVWREYAELAKWPPINSAPFASRGHVLGAQVNVVVNAANGTAYQALVADSVLPEGALLGELPSDASAPGARAFAMQKRTDGWSYLELDGQGHILAEGHLARCEGCHALAPSDHLFGLPRP